MAEGLGSGVALGEAEGFAGTGVGAAPPGLLPLSPWAETKGSHSGAEPAKGSQAGGRPPESQVRLPGPRPNTKKRSANANSKARNADATLRLLLRSASVRSVYAVL